MRALGYCRSDASEIESGRFDALFEKFCDANLHQPLQTFVELGVGLHPCSSSSGVREASSLWSYLTPDTLGEILRLWHARWLT